MFAIEISSLLVILSVQIKGLCPVNSHYNISTKKLQYHTQHTHTPITYNPFSQKTYVTTNNQKTMETPTQLNAKSKRHQQGKKHSKHRILGPLGYERSLKERGYNYIIGSDEVGRGALAGPVLAVSCCIILEQEEESFIPIEYVADSKELSEEKRIWIYNQIHASGIDRQRYKYSISQRSSQQIQESNILKATMECFQESIQNLIMNEDLPLDEAYAIVDGSKTPKLINGPTPIPCRPYVAADKNLYTVSIASILAKVIRDNAMIEASKLYPQYGFDQNKGYSSKSHIEAIHKYGPCPIHRMSFKPLQHR